MEFANQHWFDSPGAFPEAQGVRRSKTPDGGFYWEVNGGILNPVRHEIPVGSRLIRFGNILPHFDAAGGWWLELAAYQQIEMFAQRHRLPVQVALRMLCCVAPEWSGLSVMMQVDTIAPLLAFRGSGGPAYVRDGASGQVGFMAATAADASGTMVPQLFIPGTASADLRRDAMYLSMSRQLPPESGFRI